MVFCSFQLYFLHLNQWTHLVQNTFYQYKFDEEDKMLKEISHFENPAEKYGDYRFYFLDNNMIISQYYYYSAGTNKKFELFA